MRHENITRWLKAACIAAAVLVITVFLAWARATISTDPVFMSGYGALRWPMAFWICGIGALCCLALRSFWGVCGRIGEDRSFSAENVIAMGQIARHLWLASGMTAVLAILLFTLTALSGASITQGSLFLPVLLACLFAGVALLSKALSLLLAKAVDLQADHDLTV